VKRFDVDASSREFLKPVPAEVLKSSFRVVTLKLHEEHRFAAAGVLTFAEKANQMAESEASEPKTAAELPERWIAFRHRRHDKSSRNEKTQATRISACFTALEKARKIPGFEVSRFVARRPKLEVLHELAVAAEVSASVIDVDKQFRTTLGRLIAPYIAERH
jgi:hypothetical protein